MLSPQKLQIRFLYFSHHVRKKTINFSAIPTKRKKKEVAMAGTSIPLFLAGSNVQKWVIYMPTFSFKFNFYITNLQFYSVLFSRTVGKTCFFRYFILSNIVVH